jgi:ABC-type nitrate/sulfonate/bicarbonate transport system permease component
MQFKNGSNAAIMVAILAAIFNMVAKTHKKFRSAPMLQLQRKLIYRGF